MGGHDKPKEAKPATATSTFNGVRNSNVSLPGFGVGSTTISGEGDNKTIDTTFAPDQQISTILSGAKQGVQDNQSIFNLTPEQQFSQVESNPYYQQQKLQNQQFLTQGQADARHAASQSGLQNSTIAGSIEASLLNDAALNDWAARTGAIDYSRGLAAQNMGINQGLMDQIFGYTSEPTQLSNQTLMSAGDNQDQTNMFNAGQIQNANIANTQMANQMAMQRAQNRSALIGNIVGAVGTIGGGIAMGPMGAQIGGSLGKMAGNVFTRK